MGFECSNPENVKPSRGVRSGGSRSPTHSLFRNVQDKVCHRNNEGRLGRGKKV